MQIDVKGFMQWEMILITCLPPNVLQALDSLK